MILFTIVNDLNDQFKEWVSYYKDLGISHMHIADNCDNYSGSVYECLKDVCDPSYVTVYDRRGKSLSVGKCLNDLYEIITKQKSNDLIMVAMPDEIIELKSVKTLDELCNKIQFDFVDSVSFKVNSSIDENNFELISKRIYKVNKPILTYDKQRLYFPNESNKIINYSDGRIIKYFKSKKEQDIYASRFIPSLKSQPEPKIDDDGGISICITAYKMAQYIEETLDSVVNQSWFKTHDSWEILVGIDSCEETLEKMKSIMGKYKNLRVFMMDSNRGTYVTTNTIMKQAKYDNLLRFDADDIMRPNMIETLMLNRDKGDIFMFKMKNFGELTNVCNAIGQIFVKRSVFDEYGGFREWSCSADAEFRKRVKYMVKTYAMDEILMDRRSHSESLTRKPGDTCMKSGQMGSARQKYLNILKKMKVTDKKDAIIECVTNTYKEINIKND